MFRHAPKTINEMAPMQEQYFRPLSSPLVVPHAEPSSNSMIKNRNLMEDNVLWHRVFEKRNITRLPTAFSARSFYSNSGFMTVKWAASLSQRMSKLSLLLRLKLFDVSLEDKFVVFFVIFSATILTLAHICGILTVRMICFLFDHIDSQFNYFPTDFSRINHRISFHTSSLKSSMLLFHFCRCLVSMPTCPILPFGFDYNRIFHSNKIYSNSMLKHYN